MKAATCLIPLALLAGCASLPAGPRVAVMPTPGKPFEVFVAEERLCRDYAASTLGTDRNELSGRNVVEGAIAGTAIGATAGALGGGQRGAAAGAAAGLVIGSAAGAGNAGYAGSEAQRAYDIAEVRFREGISTQLELSETRVQLQQALANRARAARDLQVARKRLELLPYLPMAQASAPSSMTTNSGTNR